MNPSRPLMAASAALPLDQVAAYERGSNKRSRTRRFHVLALPNGILGLLVLALLFMFLYGPDKFVETFRLVMSASGPRLKLSRWCASTLWGSLALVTFMLRKQ